MTRHRHALGDDPYAAIEPLLPTNARPGRPWKGHRRVIDGILWILHTGCPRRDLPRLTYGPWQGVYERFNRWTEDGTRGRLLEALRVRLDASGKVDRDLFCIDGSSIRASRDAAGASPTDGTSAEPADHALGRSRGGYGSKIHLVCDGKRLPMTVAVTAGQRHEATQFEPGWVGWVCPASATVRGLGPRRWPVTRATARGRSDDPTDDEGSSR